MDIGYSLLLREFVVPTEVDYGDCQQFQITCPSCHEAIFKAGKYGQDRQYFSHYPSSKSDARQCELRVAAISQAAISEKNSFGHGQSMERFFATSRSFVLRWLWRDQADTISRRVNWMVARQAFIAWADDLRSIIRRREEQHHVLRRQIISKLLDRSDFWMKRQIEFAADFTAHLIAPNSTTLFRFFVGLAVCLNEDFSKDEKHVLLYGDDRRLKRQIAELMKNDDHYHIFNTSFLRTFDLLMMTIPYLDLLDDRTDDTANRTLLLATVRRVSLPKPVDRL